MFHPKSLPLPQLLMLLAFTFQTFYPTMAWALADGPDQPDFAAYEDFDAPDMVNLATGDFTYNIPLLNVPSPEGGFQIPLSYHAGIELNEEATWVGLGWSLNPGAINRKVSCYPDDYNGQVASTQLNNPGTSGYFFSSFDGINQRYYDSNRGWGGAGSFSFFNWDQTGSIGISAFGLKIKDGKATFNALELAQQTAKMALNVATNSQLGRLGINTNSALFQSANMGGALFARAASGTAPTDRMGLWSFQYGSYSTNFLGTSTSYTWKYFLNYNGDDSNYGTLYLGDMPYQESANPLSINSTSMKVCNNSSSTAPNDGISNTVRYYSGNNVNPSSDMWIDGSGDYANDYHPTHLAYDNYAVLGKGIGGLIKPYREDFGSLSNPVLSSSNHFCYVGPRFLPRSDYKVQFKYEGDFSNSYTHHNPSSDLNKKPFPFTVDDTQNSNTEHAPVVTAVDPEAYVNYPACTNCVPTLSAYNPYYSSAARTEGNRNGRYQNRLARRRHIDWFTNSEITNGFAASKGFLNTHQGYDRTTNAQTGRNVPSAGIGGFSITNENGLTFHYALPVYNKQEAFLAKDGNTTRKKTDNNWYATTWLLTGITGPDFVDRGTIGIIDPNDWGYWVKLDYGQFATDYFWRSPYWGFNDRGSCKIGKKETYYLNTISTRSHTAMFIKSLRSDGKSYYESDGLYNTVSYAVEGPGNSHKPSSSLKLDDIYVLANEDYKDLTQSAASGGLGLNQAGSAAYDSELKNSDSYNTVWDSHDLTSTTLQQFLTDRQLQRIHFNYDYRLCNKTYNSFDFDASGNAPIYDAATAPASTQNLKGKLSLISLEMHGRNDQSNLPDYIFTYGRAATYGLPEGDNPDYDPDKYDGYGMYKQGGGNCAVPSIHTSEKKADQWCLTEVLTPLGSKVTVEYERDSYSEINGLPVKSNSPARLSKLTDVGTGSIPFVRDYVSVCADNFGTNANLADYFNIGDEIGFWNGSAYAFNAKITGFGNGKIYLDNTSWNGGVSDAIAEARVFTEKKYGGGLRVKNISISEDDGSTYTTSYLYTKNGSGSGVTSGVASYEPISDRATNHADFDFYKQYDHPFSTILYSDVSVITGRPGDAVYKENQRSSYHFVTPKQTMISTSKDMVKADGYCHTQTLTNFSQIPWYSGWGTFNTIVNTAGIGNLDTVKYYNEFGHLQSKTVFEYTDNAYSMDYPDNLGSYTECTLLWEVINCNILSTTSPCNGKKLKIMQSYKLRRPSILKSVTTYEDRLISKKEILNYDYISGEALSTRSTYGGIEVYEDEYIPAYVKYPSLGSKIFDPANKNVLKPRAASYAYVRRSYNTRNLLGTSVTTWANDHKYRAFSGSAYVSQALPVNSAPYQSVWLPKQEFTWKSIVEENGTIKSGATDPEKFVDFNWSSNNQDPHWKKTSEINLYDHFSNALEVSDISNTSASSKYNYGHSYLGGSCANAKYVAWCFSGAEDKSPDPGYFYGEVGGASTQFLSTTYAHTGNYCSAVPQGQTGFRFQVQTSDLPVSPAYRASVWIHKSSLSSARLYCKYTNGNYVAYTTSATNPSAIEQAGDWYQFKLDVDVTNLIANTTLEFGVENIGGNVVFSDDFRTHPINSPITTSVYDAKTGLVMATLNGDNYASKFEYDASGRVTTVYKETKSGFVRTMKKTYHYARQ